MIIKSLKFSSKLVLILSIIFILSVVSLFAWIVTSPRSLSSITPSIEKELSSISPDIDVKISESFIKWDNNTSSVVIEASDISVINKNKESIAKFPKIEFDFNIIKFLSGHLISSDITVINPSFNIDTTNKALFFKGKIDDNKNSISFLSSFFESLKKGKYNLPVNSIRIKDADFFISNGYSDFVWHAKSGYLKIEKRSKIISELVLNFAKNETYIGAEISFTEGVFDSKFNFKGVPSHIITDLFPEKNILKNLNVESDGSADLLVSETGEVLQASFDIDNIKGNIELSDTFPEKFNILAATAKGSFYNDFSVLSLEAMDLKIDDSIVLVSGNFSNLIPSPDFTPMIEADVTVKNFEVDNLQKYWPLLLGKKVRNWVITNITEAKVAKASGHFSFKPEYFESMYEWKRGGKTTTRPRMDEDAIDALIDVVEGKVAYKNPFPDITNIAGTVSFSGKTMKADIKSANINDTSVKSAVVIIDDMNIKNAPISIKGEFDGYVRDSIAFLKPILKNYKTTEVLESIYNSSGKVKGSVDLSFPIKRKLRHKNFNVDITSSFSNTTIPSFINGHDLEGSSFSLELKNNNLKIKGNAKVINTPVYFSYNRDIKKANESDYSVKGEFNASELSKLGLVDLPYTENKLDVDVKIRERKNITYINGEADIKKASISIPSINFIKKAGEDGKIVFVMKKYDNERVEIKNFTVSGSDYKIYGSVDLSQSKIKSLDISNAKYANNDYSLSYNLKNNTHNISINGKKLDLSDVSFADLFKKDSESKSLKIIAKASIDTVKMKNSESFSKLTFDMNCSTKLCSSINAYAKTKGDAFIVLSVKPVGDSSSVMLESDNAGSVINAFGLSKHVQGGRLTLEATFSKNNSDSIIAQGLLQVHDFTAIKTPVLGKLLTLASLKGISDLLNNKGITFKRFAAPFHISKNVITLHDAKTAGASIGLTSEGTIDLNSGHIDLSGAIVPAYEVNKVLGDIPLLGNLLIGKKNEGVIATKYRIKGPHEDAKITVNPLTILTPGFLRNIFDIF